jgi:hypothetical protein
MSCYLIVVYRQRGAIRFSLEQRGLGHWQRLELLGSQPVVEILAHGRQVTQWFRTKLVTVSKGVWVLYRQIITREKRLKDATKNA